MSDPHTFSLFDPPEDSLHETPAPAVELKANISVDPKIEESWKKVLKDEFQKPYFNKLKQFLVEEQKAGYKILPPANFVFEAFRLSPFEKTKVVIIGQDPYHGIGQCHGPCFSVQKDIAVPPSLHNIYKEIHEDLGLPIPNHGNLEHWAEQGVLMLNAVLTVRAHQPTSHSGKGWEEFTDQVIRTISDQKEQVVFLLWGSFAKSKQSLIDTKKHHILTAAHPSPFSAYSGFFGCRHFSKTNEILRKTGQEPIDWKVE